MRLCGRSAAACQFSGRQQTESHRGGNLKSKYRCTDRALVRSTANVTNDIDVTNATSANSVINSIQATNGITVFNAIDVIRILNVANPTNLTKRLVLLVLLLHATEGRVIKKATLGGSILELVFEVNRSRFWSLGFPLRRVVHEEN